MSRDGSHGVRSAHELVVVGAGPAGMSGALAAADDGVDVALVDAGARPGGQYYRHLPTSLAADRGAGLHHRFATGADLLDRVQAHRRIRLLTSTSVWAAERAADGLVLRGLRGHRGDPASVVLVAGQLLLATGAYDRALPFPGWTLPGVMTPGGAQALLKGQAVLAGRRVLVGGTGPFLLPVAAGLVRAGAQVVAVVEANRPSRWVPGLPALARTPARLAEAAGYVDALRRHRVPLHVGRVVTGAIGDGVVSAAHTARVDRGWRVVPGSETTHEVDTVCVGWGFTPQLELALQLGCATTLVGDTLVVTADALGATSVPGVLVAGEPTGVGGATRAAAQGTLAGLAAAVALGRTRERTMLGRARPLLRLVAREQAFAAALQAAYPVRDGWVGRLDAADVVCRCEEVTMGEIDSALSDLGADDVRTVKLLTRAGMGMCQGRVCGSAVEALLTSRTGRALTPEAAARSAARPLSVPVPLEVLADDATP